MNRTQALLITLIVLFGLNAKAVSADQVKANYQPLVSQAEVTKAINTFVTEMESKHGFNGQKLAKKLKGLNHRQDIIERITKPAESMPWHRYRQIWMKDSRINGGIEFWQQHKSSLERAYEKFGVPPEIIVGIIGVETFYGKIQGDFPVMEALHTLGFYYPKRAKFFRSELAEFLLLTREQGWSWDDIKGSYAGAMGMGQFISSSYRAYAIDFNGDGQINLFSDPVDMIGSVANYFKQHKWTRNGFVAKPISLTAEQKMLVQSELPLRHELAELAGSGIDIKPLGDRSRRAGIFAFELADGSFEHWIGGENFYSITRYNHNAMYALAVHQLSQAISLKRSQLTNNSPRDGGK